MQQSDGLKAFSQDYDLPDDQQAVPKDPPISRGQEGKTEAQHIGNRRNEEGTSFGAFGEVEKVYRFSAQIAMSKLQNAR